MSRAALLEGLKDWFDNVLGELLGIQLFMYSSDKNVLFRYTFFAMQLEDRSQQFGL
jgi:hypothetical protein